MKRSNVWHQRRAQRVRCMPGLDSPAKMEGTKRTTGVGEAPTNRAGCGCGGVKCGPWGCTHADVLTTLTATTIGQERQSGCRTVRGRTAGADDGMESRRWSEDHERRSGRGAAI